MSKVLCLFVDKSNGNPYRSGLRDVDIRNYQVNYRGKIYIVESKTNTIIAQMQLNDCYLLTKDFYEMNYHRHRIYSDYESLPYANSDKPAYVWDLSYDFILDEKITIERTTKYGYEIIEDIDITNVKSHLAPKNNEIFAIKNIRGELFVFWLKKDRTIRLVGEESLFFNGMQVVPLLSFSERDLTQEECDYIKPKLTGIQ